jgi:hypothetical protein
MLRYMHCIILVEVGRPAEQLVDACGLENGYRQGGERLLRVGGEQPLTIYEAWPQCTGIGVGIHIGYRFGKEVVGDYGIRVEEQDIVALGNGYPLVVGLGEALVVFVGNEYSLRELLLHHITTVVG